MAGIFGPDTVDTAAKLLAGEHAADDEGIQEIFQVPHATEVRLIEITSSVQPDGEVLPFRFTEAPPEVPVKSVVVLMNPKDWARRAELRWPPELDPIAHDVELIFERRRSA